MRTTQEITDEVNYLADQGLTPRISTQEERDAEVARIIVADANGYLASTDWVIAKISEAQLKGDDVTALMTEYEEVFTLRAQARTLNNGGN